MRAKDIMTTNVVTIAADARVGEAANIMLENNISGLPVVNDAGNVVGIISEGDLLHRQETGTEEKRSWWLRFFSSPQEDAHDFVKSHGNSVSDAMTDNVVTVDSDTGVGEIATIMEEQRIKRLPVVEDGKLVGIVSRANLLQALATKLSEDVAAPSVDDRSLREAVTAVMAEQDYATHGALNVMVNDGVVELWGWVESEDERKALCLAAEGVAGVKEVVDHLGKVPPWLQGT
jgi:CBS domain-containing protein